MNAVIATSVWRKFICRACGLIYDEAEGDADSGLAPGTRFEDIPDDWSCPLCGVTKADFEPYDAQPLSRTARAASSMQHKSQKLHQQRADAGVVIVGAGCAGWQMARALRERDADMPITLVTACNGDVYDKPLLSVALAKGLALPALIKESAVDAAARLQVRLLAQTHAVSVSTGSSALRTTRGTLKYRHLILAHGAAPRALPQLPADLCWRINDLQSYMQFRQSIGAPPATAPKRILIAGAGLVGCELANDLALAGHAVTLLDIHPLPLGSLLDEQASRDLLNAWEGLPLRFVGGTCIAGVSVSGEIRQVRTEDGQVFEAELVVSATGLHTPSRLARSAGLTWNDGIAVDAESLCTNVANIHALGDCISINGQAHRFIEPINRQARLIAAKLTGDVAAPYVSTRPPVRVKTGSRGFTISQFQAQ